MSDGTTEVKMARTLLDVIEAGEAAPYQSRIVYPNGTPIPHFRCRCGRLVTADMMLDLNPGTCGGICSSLRGPDRFRCDGCWSRWRANGQVTDAEIVAHAERYAVRRALKVIAGPRADAAQPRGGEG